MSRADAGARSALRAALLRAAPVLLLVGSIALMTAGCRQDMHDQPRIKPLAENTFFANGSRRASAARRHGRARPRCAPTACFYTGRHADDSLLADAARCRCTPQACLLRGRDRFDIFCSPCHGQTGDGDGMVVRRGYKQPTSYHVDRLRRRRSATSSTS